jgi:3-methyladenine DNA glycosylase AlkC
MTEPFKNAINTEVIHNIAGHCQRVWADFPQQSFIAAASEGLDSLELKARIRHVASALAGALPADFDKAASILEQTLAPVGLDTPLGELKTSSLGLAGWATWPLCEYVAEQGQQHPQRALACLCELTQRSTAEFAIRPFLRDQPALCYAQLQQWLNHPSSHVRRWVSEGSRPRLPWGLRLTALVQDPSPNLPLLNALVNDPSSYVRRSVANHLNDISKDHPDIAVQLASQWLREYPGEPTRQLVRHGLRGLIRQGRADVLALLGFDGADTVSLTALSLDRVHHLEGEALRFQIRLHNGGTQPLRLSLDYAIHYCKANGQRVPKIFKWLKPTLAPGETLTLSRQHALKRVTTRRHYPGEHGVDIRINGQPHGWASFILSLPNDEGV